MALCAAQLAASKESDNVETSLGAVKLVSLAGFKGASPVSSTISLSAANLSCTFSVLLLRDCCCTFLD